MQPPSSSTWFAVLGREQTLAYAELAAVTGSDTLQRFEQVVCGTDAQPDWQHIGGVIRSGQVLATHGAGLNAVMTAIQDRLTADQATGKINLGVSFVTPAIKPHQVQGFGKQLKTHLKAAGFNIRVVPARAGTSLNSAQVQYNKLLGPHYEFCLWRDETGWQLGRTTWIQDIEGYTQRDRGRPARDARVGMLPPKLAQMMINLAAVPISTTLYDPFCGTGVLLLEGLEQGLKVAGSDKAADMVAATQTNLAWWYEKHETAVPSPLPVTEQDALRLRLPDESVIIVAEGYLGRVDLKQTQASAQQIEAEAKRMDQFYRTVLTHWRNLSQINGIILALPFWSFQGRRFRLELLDDLGSLGYTGSQFVGTNRRELTYHRPDQIVGRMIVKLTPH